MRFVTRSFPNSFIQWLHWIYVIRVQPISLTKTADKAAPLSYFLTDSNAYVQSKTRFAFRQCRQAAGREYDTDKAKINGVSKRVNNYSLLN